MTTTTGSRPVKLRVRFTALPGTGDGYSVEYAVELHRGQRSTTVGRVWGSRPVRNGPVAGWNALRIGSHHWTAWRKTRTEAVADLLDRYNADFERQGAMGAGIRYTEPTWVTEGLTFRQAVEWALTEAPPRRVPRPREAPGAARLFTLTT